MRTLKTLVAAVALICAVQSVSLAETKRIKFRNVTGEHGNALRIEFNTEVELLSAFTYPISAFAMSAGNGTTTLTLARGAADGVADGETLELTVDGLEAPVVVAARWSRANTLTPTDDSWLGDTMVQKLTHIVFESGVALGVGRLSVELDDVVALFEFTAGEPAPVAAGRFGLLIEGLEYASLVAVKGNHVLAMADSLGDDVGLVITEDPPDPGLGVLVYTEEPTDLEFLRGDVDGNGSVASLVDPIYLLRWGFLVGEVPPCMRAADIDGNDEVNAIIDALYLLIHRFGDGDAPPAPGPDECGTDPVSTLSCETPLDDCA